MSVVAPRPALPALHHPPEQSAAALLEDLLPEGARAAVSWRRGEADDPLPAAACSALARAGPKRQRDFAAGRRCARAALGRFGLTGAVVAVAADGRPLWPEGFTGSITHTDGFAAAVAGERARFWALGIDAECSGRVTREIWSQVLLPAECRWIEGLPAERQAQAATLVFSAKEAFYKCQYQVTRQWLDFTDVAVVFRSGNLRHGHVSVHASGACAWLRLHRDPPLVHFRTIGNLIVTAIALAAGT